MKQIACGKNMLLWLLLSALSMSTGCRRTTAGPRCTDLRPQPAPLPPEILLITQPDSTDLLQRASRWSENSQQLLDSVKTN